MKKLLFISNVTQSITNFAIPSIRAAQELGYAVHMAADYSGFQDDPEKYNVTLHQIDLARSPLHPKNLTAYRQMMHLLRTEKFDAIHCNTPIGGLLGRLCGSRAGVRKIIYTAHGFHFYKGAPLLNRLLYKPIERFLAHKTDALITITREDYAAAQRFRLKKGGQVFYVPGVGIDRERFLQRTGCRQALRRELSIPEDAVLLISVGELNENKNNQVILNAMAACKCQNLYYVLCGVGGQEDALRALAQQLGLADRVQFLGYRSDVPALFEASDIFVLPSLREGLSRSVMEAMTAGLPCVLSEIRGNVDLIEPNTGGFLCPARDPQAFAEALSRLARDDDLRQRMGAHNAECSARYDVRNICSLMDEIYQKTLSSEILTEGEKA